MQRESSDFATLLFCPQSGQAPLLDSIIILKIQPLKVSELVTNIHDPLLRKFQKISENHSKWRLHLNSP